MAKRRTKREKIAAKMNRNFISVPEKSFNVENEPISRNNFYVPEFSLSTKLLKGDLTKSLAVTILALILQFSLAAYLNHGGWQSVNNILQKMTTNF